MKALRRVLEQDLRLERDALKPMKKVVNSFVDNVRSITSKSILNDNPTRRFYIQLLLKTRFKGQTDEKAHQRKSHSQPRDEGMKQARNLTARFKKLRDICKQASISIPPSLYRKDNGSKDMESAILEILRRNGLDENSQKASIMAVKEQLQLERDLDGIDKGNIINDGPRSRRKAVRYESIHIWDIYIWVYGCFPYFPFMN
jgi:hypothetical protein